MEGTEGMEGVVVDETPDPGSGGAGGATEGPTYYERRLERIDDGRWIAGVCTGLADYFAIPVWLVRVIFFLLLGPAGIGFILYLALIAFMPHESEDESPAERMFGEMDSPGKWGGALLAVVGGLALLGAATNIDGGVIVAIALVAIGVILFQSSIGSRATPADEAPVDASGGGGRPPREPRPPRQPRDYGQEILDYPLTLTKIIVTMRPHILYVDEERPVDNRTILLDRLGLLDPPEGM